MFTKSALHKNKYFCYDSTFKETSCFLEKREKKYKTVTTTKKGGYFLISRFHKVFVFNLFQ